jgi:hypothetical protein
MAVGSDSMKNARSPFGAFLKVVLGASLVACGAPATGPGREPELAQVDTRDSGTTTSRPLGASPGDPASASPQGTGIQCGSVRCTEEKPICCRVLHYDDLLGGLAAGEEKGEENSCVARAIDCEGMAMECRGAADCPEGERCGHDASQNFDYCTDETDAVFFLCLSDAECDVLGCEDAICKDGTCKCP